MGRKALFNRNRPICSFFDHIRILVARLVENDGLYLTDPLTLELGNLVAIFDTFERFQRLMRKPPLSVLTC